MSVNRIIYDAGLSAGRALHCLADPLGYAHLSHSQRPPGGVVCGSTCPNAGRRSGPDPDAALVAVLVPGMVWWEVDLAAGQSEALEFAVRLVDETPPAQLENCATLFGGASESEECDTTTINVAATGGEGVAPPGLLWWLEGVAADRFGLTVRE